MEFYCFSSSRSVLTRNNGSLIPSRANETPYPLLVTWQIKICVMQMVFSASIFLFFHIEEKLRLHHLSSPTWYVTLSPTTILLIPQTVTLALRTPPPPGAKLPCYLLANLRFYPSALTGRPCASVYVVLMVSEEDYPFTPSLHHRLL